MKSPFRLYGAELSPYSVKVRAYLRFKDLPFEWLTRTNARQEEFARYAKLPLIPVLVDADDEALQDSTPIIETVEAAFPEPAITPQEPALAFMSALLEDYADEWLNKAMFHYRWTYPEDQASAATRIATALFEDAEAPEGMEEAIRARMAARLHHVGSSPETLPVIEASFKRALVLVEALLSQNPYLFGARPSLADFGLAGQFAQLLSDPTPGAIIKADAPKVVAWLARMEAPKVEGASFASAASLRDGLVALLRQELSVAYLPWMVANAAAVADDESEVRLDIAGGAFSQKPQRYAAKAFAALQTKRAQIDDETLAALLEDGGCAAFFAASPTDDADDAQSPEEAAAPDDPGEDA
jgi:glutathione S-transferase